jgi:hypothetical protein
MSRSVEAIQRRKEQDKARYNAALAAGRDVGPCPELSEESRQRRDACERNLRLFLITYLSARFTKPFCHDHEEVIADLERVILEGGQSAVAMPRGHGKTSLMLGAALWAILYGHRKFLVLLAATESHAEKLLGGIKTQIEVNPLLYSDFPEVAYFVWRLNRQPTKAPGQTSLGCHTRIEWGKGAVTFPYVANSRVSSSRIECYGLTGAVRGTTHETPDGRSVRPDLMLVDDPQTDKSAKSATMTRERRDIIEAAVMGLAGPGVKISALAAVTVIEQGDLSSTLLDREKSPHWQGRRYKLLVVPPSNMQLWDEYTLILRQSLKAGQGIKPATDFYAANRDAMDAGAGVSWAERFNEDELSAIQHAMNLRIQDEAKFASEFQNEPLAPVGDAILKRLDADEVIKRVTGVPRFMVPLESTRLTGFIDVQDESLWYVLVAWDENFSGDVIDYGVWPRQERVYVRKNDLNPTLSQQYKGSLEERWHLGLRDLCAYLLRPWARHGHDSDLTVDKVLIDANYGTSADTVYKFIRTSGHRSILVPSHGMGVSAAKMPMDEWGDAIGVQKGKSWRLMEAKGNRKQRHLVYDTNHWKTWVCERLQAGLHSRGRIALYGDKPAVHQLFGDHSVSERATATFRRDGQSRVDAWHGVSTDNELWDGLVGCAVGASLAGLVWSAERAAGLGRGRVAVGSSRTHTAQRNQEPATSTETQTTQQETPQPAVRHQKRKLTFAEAVARAKEKALAKRQIY